MFQTTNQFLFASPSYYLQALFIPAHRVSRRRFLPETPDVENRLLHSPPNYSKVKNWKEETETHTHTHTPRPYWTGLEF